MSSKKRGLPQQIEMRHDAHYVDSLTRRFEQHVGKYVPIDSLSPNPDQPRVVLGDLDELKASILSKGILEPILVRAMPGSQGHYQIISGERRYHAALEAGLEEIPVIEIEAGDAEALEIALIENLQRKDLSTFEQADGYGALVDRYGYTQEKVADLIGKARSSVAELLRIRMLSPDIRELCRVSGIEAKSMLVEISRLESEEQMRRMIQAIAAGEIDRASLRAIKRGGAEAGPIDGGGEKPKPFVFRLAPKDRDFRFQISFRKADVSRAEVIETLEGILEELKASPNIEADGGADQTKGESGDAS